MNINKLSVSILILCLIGLSSSAAYASSDYYDYSYRHKIKIFHDEFVDDRNNWGSYDNKDEKSEIKDGYFWYKTRKDGTLTPYKTISFNENRDFEIETSIRIVEGNNGKGNYLQWGRSSDTWSLYGFLLSDTKKLSIAKYDNGWHDYVPWKYSGQINNGFMKLTVRKIKNRYYFFINETFVSSAPFEPFFGERVGFGVGPKCRIAVDYLRISYLKSRSAQTGSQLDAGGGG